MFAWPIKALSKRAPMFTLAVVSLLQGLLQSTVFSFQSVRALWQGEHIGRFYTVLFAAGLLSFALGLTAARRIGLSRLMQLAFVCLAVSLLSFSPLLNGVSIGLFWAARHGYELSFTRNDTRDGYVCRLSLIQQIAGLLLPAVIALGAWLIGGKDPLRAINLGLAVLCLPAIVLASRLPSAKAPLGSLTAALERAMATRFPTLWLAEAFDSSVKTVAAALAMAKLAGSLTTVGTLEAAAATLAALLSALMIRRWSPGTRSRFYAVGLLGTGCGWLVLGTHYTIEGLFVLVTARAVFGPMAAVGEHVVTQSSIERMGGELLANLTVRETILLMGRIIGIAVAVSVPLPTLCALIAACAVGQAFLVPWVVNGTHGNEVPRPA